MAIQDDETLRMYLEESLEHLADIENDFLTIEENGANINEDLVNKVYRAAHSIKGGAGFMGLTNIKDLTHEMENILGKIRAREMVPTPDIVNVLLSASDTLKSLMKDILNSNDIDISDQIKALKAVLEANGKSHGKATAKNSAPAKEKEKAAKPVQPEPAPAPSPVVSASASPANGQTLALFFPDGQPALSMDAKKVTPYFTQGKFIYLVKMEVTGHIQAKGKNCKTVLEEMEQTGLIIGANFTLQPVAELAADWLPDVPAMFFLFATILKPSDINVLFEIEDEDILELRSDLNLYKLNGTLAPVSDGATPPPAKPQAAPKSSAVATPKHTVVAMPPEPVVSPEPEAVPTELVEEDEEPGEQTVSVVQASDSGPDAPGDKKGGKFEHETSLRVHVSLLDQLMTLAGELVLSRNQLLQSMGSNDKRGSEVAGQRIDLITSELQEAIMLTRMQSIGNVFNKFPRVVRDLARMLGKQVELSLEGKDVELDKTIIEAIGDPLTHLVRNAVDHGIEPTEVRKKAGKNPVGQIFLRAYHEAGQVNIEISDDGKGLDGYKIASKAVEKGLITEEQAKIMSTRERINLIFLPGFSTAEKVTEVSGRGVGMDVVKTNLDMLGGIIDIDSEVGKGTTIRIKLPLTLAIIPCQIVVTGGERYAIPQVNLEELLRIPAAQVSKRIERVGNADVVRLRGNLLPLIRLADIIGADSHYVDPESGEAKNDRRKSILDRRSKQSPLISRDEKGTEDDACQPEGSGKSHSDRGGDRRYHSASALNIVVVSTGSMKYGLVVDQLQDSEEIVVKPLGRDLKKCKGYAGATIMGDGRVALILDVSNLAQMAGLSTVEGSARAAEVAEKERAAVRAGRDRQSLLLFRGAVDEQFAAPLNLVERIEKINRADIEHLGGKQVMQYRGGTLPLFTIDQVASVKPLADQENLLVIVFVVAGREIGLLAIGPVDALEASLNIDGTTLRQTGIMGSVIVNNSTTQLVDIVEIVQTLNPEWFKKEESKKKKEEEGKSATILFAEDSSFFRSQVKGSMVKEGFEVLEAEDGVIAWDLLQQNAENVSIVVTDIEMPNMDGFTLTRKIKEHPIYSRLPVIALTTLAGEEDIARGKAAGIDDYQIKLDRERLIKSIHD
ncbi:MAG: chemotaxis protein CheW, partial [Desulfobacteraceae bacterium]|nr:chemotaxis protein CheW [Desulfobacteraceae bacterium]